MTYAMFISPRHLIKALWILTSIALILPVIKPTIGQQFFRRIESLFHRSANTRYAILVAAAFPLIVRAMMLPWFPPPRPIVHDEFSYLLQSDTFAHGRLANPTPPYWEHFETEYTLLQPVYASQYQPAQGAVLALGQIIFGHPWWGVWLSVGIMCGAICWALRFVLPPAWALFGSMLAALQFGIFGIWMNSYFGGAVSATAGALVFGALAAFRTPEKWRSMSMLCAFGIILLFATRPFEALLWIAVAILYLLWSLRRRGWTLRVSLAPLVVPFAVVFAAGAAALAYYNWRVTGNPAVPPYLAYQHIYGTPQPYWWQAPVFATGFHYELLRDNYLNQLHLYQARYSPARMFSAEIERLGNFWQFFAGPLLTPALLFAGAIFRDRKSRPWLLVSVPFIADKATYHAWFPSHSGPATILIVLFLVMFWRHMRAFRRRSRYGVAVSRLLLAAFSLTIFLGVAGRAVEGILPHSFRHFPPIWSSLYPPARLRDDVSDILERSPGKHLLFVKYSNGHCFCEEWVFNGADLPNQRIVYARPYTAESDEALKEWFGDRSFDAWMVEPDLHPYRLTRLKPARSNPESSLTLSSPAVPQ